MRPEERLPTKRTASSGSRVPPAVTSTCLPREASRPWTVGQPEQLLDALEDLLGLRHPPHSELALGRLALVGADQLHPALAESRRVRLRGRMRPHARVHRGRDEHGPPMGERRLGEHVVREPVRELGHRVRGQRRDHEQVGARQVRVEIFLRRPACERGERLTADEAVRPVRDDGNDVVPGLDEQARQLASLVGGDPAGDPEEHLGHGHILPTAVKIALAERLLRSS